MNKIELTRNNSTEIKKGSFFSASPTGDDEHAQILVLASVGYRSGYWTYNLVSLNGDKWFHKPFPLNMLIEKIQTDNELKLIETGSEIKITVGE